MVRDGIAAIPHFNLPPPLFCVLLSFDLMRRSWPHRRAPLLLFPSPFTGLVPVTTVLRLFFLPFFVPGPNRRRSEFFPVSNPPLFQEIPCLVFPALLFSASWTTSGLRGLALVEDLFSLFAPDDGRQWIVSRPRWNSGFLDAVKVRISSIPLSFLPCTTWPQSHGRVSPVKPRVLFFRQIESQFMSNCPPRVLVAVGFMGYFRALTPPLPFLLRGWRRGFSLVGWR